MSVNLLLGVELSVEQWQISECGAQGGDKYKHSSSVSGHFLHPNMDAYWALQQSLLMHQDQLATHS
jgi:hypothetical protein